jgi:hypothetical protein
LHLGDHVEQDTSEATTNAQDDELNENCGAPATNGSVWYKYTPTVDRIFVLDVASSDFNAGALIFEGPPTADSLVACGPEVIAVRARAGKTYNIMVISTDAAGGALVLSLEKPPPAPRVHVRVAKRGLAYRGGAARIHGHYYCRNGDFAVVFGTLVQRAGRMKIPAGFERGIRCDGARHSWSARLVSRTGLYARGRARARVTIVACGMVQCADDTARRRIRLRWARAQDHMSMEPTTSLIERPRPLIEIQRWPGS